MIKHKDSFFRHFDQDTYLARSDEELEEALTGIKNSDDLGGDPQQAELNKKRRDNLKLITGKDDKDFGWFSLILFDDYRFDPSNADVDKMRELLSADHANVDQDFDFKGNYELYSKLFEEYNKNKEERDTAPKIIQENEPLKKKFTKRQVQISADVEAGRTTERMLMAISPQLLARIDSAYREEGYSSRQAWIYDRAKQYMDSHNNNAPPEFPDFKSSSRIMLRPKPDINRMLSLVADHNNISKSELIRRICHYTLKSRNLQANLEPKK